MILFSKRLSELRAAQGWTQSQLARRSGISKQVISNLEHKDQYPSVKTQELLAAAFCLDREKLMAGVKPSFVSHSRRRAGG